MPCIFCDNFQFMDRLIICYNCYTKYRLDILKYIGVCDKDE